MAPRLTPGPAKGSPAPWSARASGFLAEVPTLPNVASGFPKCENAIDTRNLTKECE